MFRILLSLVVCCSLASVGGCGKNRVSRDQFTTMVRGKWSDKAVELTGPPDRTERLTDGTELWYFEGRTFDPASGKNDSVAVIHYSNGACIGVEFR